MDALKELLKVQSEMNPTAAYFNIDLLKYQVSIHEYALQLRFMLHYSI